MPKYLKSDKIFTLDVRVSFAKLHLNRAKNKSEFIRRNNETTLKNTSTNSNPN